jgi:hypothetical protein
MSVVYLYFGYCILSGRLMNESRMLDYFNGATPGHAKRLTSRRALLIALVALPLAAIVNPAPAAAQLGIPGAIFHGLFGYHGHYHGHYHGGGRHYHHYSRGGAHHRHAGAAHRSHGGGHHHAGAKSSGGPSGPGSGNFH